MNISFISLTLLFLLLFNPVGNAIELNKLLTRVHEDDIRGVMLRVFFISIIAAVVLVFFEGLLLSFIENSYRTLFLGGSLVLFFTAAHMIFPFFKVIDFKTRNEDNATKIKDEYEDVDDSDLEIQNECEVYEEQNREINANIIIFSLSLVTIPSILLLVLSNIEKSYNSLAIAVIAFIITYSMLCYSARICNSVNPRILMIIERTAGIVLIPVAAQMLYIGIH